MMEDYKCKCGGKIVFENKKTFVTPDTKNGVCIVCGKQVKLVNGKIIEK